LEAAREYLGQLDGRHRETEEALKLAQVIGEDGAGAGVVRQGGAITLLDVSTGQSQEWLLVDPREAAPLDGRLSTTSPVGHAVLGRREGDEVDVSAPRGMVRYRIVHAQ
jgi:transcription elongation factor GreB